MKLFGKKNKNDQTPPEPPKSPIQSAFEDNLKFLNKESYPKEFFEGLFTESERIKIHVAGHTDFPTGNVVIADPLVYLGTKYQAELERTVPKGCYPVELSILYSQIAGLRIAAAELKISEEKAVKYSLAEARPQENPEKGKPKPMPFMGVDAGLGCFADSLVSKEYNDFLVKWHSENPDKNHYDDYFAEFFAESFKSCPELQREGGDFIEWAVPESGNKLVMFASGLGDGIYSGYWGENEAGEITELVIPFLNPEYF